MGLSKEGICTEFFEKITAAFVLTDTHAHIFHIHKVMRRTQIRATFNIVEERVNIITLLLLLVLLT